MGAPPRSPGGPWTVLPWTVLLWTVLLCAAVGCDEGAGDGRTARDAATGQFDARAEADAAPDADPSEDPADAESPDPGAADAGPQEASPVTLSMDFTRADGFYAAPFPCESRRDAAGRVDVADFPNPRRLPFVADLVALAAHDADGFGLTSGVYFRASGAIDQTSLPDPAGSVDADASAFLISVDPTAPDRGRRYPVTAMFEDDGGPHGTPNQLSLLPVQGFPLREGVLYAAVITTAVRDAAGRPLAVSPAVEVLRAGDAPPGLGDEAALAYRAALADPGVDADRVAALAVFRTGHPRAGLLAARAQVLAAPLPRPEPFTAAERFDDFCVYDSTVEMPVFQEGTPPFRSSGGVWASNPDGTLRGQGTEVAHVVVTLPRRAMPARGFPVVVFIRTSGRGERPLVDRGVRDVAGGPARAPGTGPALDFAHAGWAGISVDGPHGGLRNVSHGDEQFLMFNFANPPAMRDNFRQTALETILVAHLLDDIAIPADACSAGERDRVFDVSQVALMGHSMGATVAPLALAAEPRFRAVLLSGAGGSWIENVVHKRRPLEVRPLAEAILLYGDRRLHSHDPALSMLQWAGEAADPPVYGALVIDEPVVGARPRHVLMMQGIADTYILPPIANATSLSLGLDLAGPAREGDNPITAAFTPLADLLGLRGRGAVALPAHGNRETPTGPVTAVVTQHLEDGIEDGHEVVFQTEAPKAEYRRFLETLVDGVPEVP